MALPLALVTLTMLAAGLYVVVTPRLVGGEAEDEGNTGGEPGEAWRGDSAGGLYLAYVGTLLLTGAQSYTLVKRSGNPNVLRRLGGGAAWLNLHIALSILGLVAILFHSGFISGGESEDLAEKGYGMLALWLLLGTTASGVFGRYVYRKLPAMKRVFRYWKDVHLVVTASLFVFILVHIVSA